MGKSYCPVCGRGYSSLRNLAQHMLRKHPRSKHTKKLVRLVRKIWPDFEKSKKKRSKRKRRKRR